MTFDQWTDLMSKGAFLSSDDDPKVENKIFEAAYEELEEEES
jgi:hypothetical protein